MICMAKRQSSGTILVDLSGSVRFEIRSKIEKPTPPNGWSNIKD